MTGARRPESPWEEWMTRGICREIDPELWFTERKGEAEYVKQAKRACNSWCEVREQCLAWALETDQEFGIWGGLDRKERLALARKGRFRIRPSRAA